MPGRRAPLSVEARALAWIALAALAAPCSCTGGAGPSSTDARSDRHDAVDLPATSAQLGPPRPQGMRAAIEAFRSGEFAHAAALLTGLEGKVDVVEDYRVYYLAESLFLSGRPGEAVRVYEDLVKLKDSRLAPLAPYRKAEALVESGRHEEAAKLYASLGKIPDIVDSASVHLGWARALEAGGKVDAARKHYEVVFAGFPQRPQAGQALEALERIEPGYAPSAEDRIARAEKLADLRMWEQAIQEIEGVEAGLDKARAREVAFKRAGYVFARRGAWADAQALFEALSKGKDDIAAESSYMVARCLEKRGLTAKAVAAYRKFLGRFKTSSLHDDALMQLLVIDYEAGRWSKVRKNAIPLLKAGTWTGDDRAQAMWMIAFAAYLEGRYPEALVLVGDYGAQATESTSRARAMYWEGVVRLELGQKDQAARLFEKIATRHPLHYYALIASRRLERMGLVAPDPEKTVGSIRRTSGQGCEGLPPKVQALIEIGLGFDAREEMRRAHSRIVKAHGADVATLERLYACAGADELLIRFAASSEDEPGERWRLLYPAPHRALVEKHAGAAHVPPLLAISIMRQESMFDPDVVSYAGAAGLMQLMPATAAAAAAEIGLALDETSLLDEETNIRLGTHYLGGLLTRFPGNIAAAVGAYNGGPGAMQRWLKARSPVPGDVFVELIPYAQTRTYVRRVLTAYARLTWIETGSLREALDWVPEVMTSETGDGPDY